RLLRPLRFTHLPYTTLFRSLITVESDKASMEIPSSDAGVVKSIKVKLGDKVKEGSLVLELEAAEGAQAAPAAEPAKAEAAPAPRSEEHTSELQSRENLVCRL